MAALSTLLVVMSKAPRLAVGAADADRQRTA